jgi:hypothetical protein
MAGAIRKVMVEKRDLSGGNTVPQPERHLLYTIRRIGSLTGWSE